MHENRTNSIEIAASNSPDPETYERIVGLIHRTRQFDGAGGHVPAIWTAGETVEDRPYIIVSDGCQSRGVYVLDPATWEGPARFATQREARAYADLITPDMPSKNLPLRVTRKATS